MVDWFGVDGVIFILWWVVRLWLLVFGFGVLFVLEDFELKVEVIDVFLWMVCELGILNILEDFGVVFILEFVGLFFDYDVLIDCLVDCGGWLEVLCGKVCFGVEYFFVCFVKIELWLYGYDVVLDGLGKLI